MKRIKEFNDLVAIKTTNFVGSMWCAYLFAAFALWGAPEGLHTLGFQNWFAEEFLQLVLLSVIMVGQNVQATKHDVLVAQHAETRKIVKEIHSAVRNP